MSSATASETRSARSAASYAIFAVAASTVAVAVSLFSTSERAKRSAVREDSTSTIERRRDEESTWGEYSAPPGPPERESTDARLPLPSPRRALDVFVSSSVSCCWSRHAK